MKRKVKNSLKNIAKINFIFSGTVIMGIFTLPELNFFSLVMCNLLIIMNAVIMSYVSLKEENL